MAITSASTQAAAINQYLDNSGYDHTGSVAACKLFIHACRALLVLHPADWAQSNTTIRYNPELWRREQAEAQAWLTANTTTAGEGRLRHLSFGGDFR